MVQPLQTSTSASEPVSEKMNDIQSLLEENIIHLRDANKHINSENNALREVAKLQEKLKEAQKRPYDGKKIIFELILAVNVLLGVCFCVSGPLLWYFHSSPIEFWWTVLGGLLWFLLIIFLSQEPWK